MKLLLRLFFTFCALYSTELFAGSLKVNLAPSAAVTAGARWQVDGGAWKTSGTTVNNLSNTTHTVTFKAVTGWITPAAMNATLTSGTTTTLSATYVQAASLKITLTPASGTWRIDGGTWQTSGTTVAGLTPGNHSIAYSSLTGYSSPTTETVSLTAGQTTTLTRSYSQLASLTVTLSPATANWRVDGGAWKGSGLTVTNLTPGSHTLEYSTLTGYTAPASESVTLNPGQVASLSRSYLQLAQLTVTVTPSTGQWRVDGGTWHNSGATVTDLMPGNHTIDFAAMADYNAPSAQNVSLVAGQTLAVSYSYNRLAQLTVILTPSSAQWSINGGPWRASGSTATGVNYGTVQVSYSPVAGYTPPPIEIVPLDPGQSATLIRSYAQLAQLTITLTPAIAQWRVDGGAWRTSSTTATGLTAGNHTVTYETLTGYVAPPDETVSLPAGQTTTLTRNYLQLAQLTITLTPSSAQWRLDNGAWQASGTTLGALLPGEHTVDYSNVSGYTSPASESITLTGGANPTLTRTYGQPTGSLIVSLTPASGQWRVDGGAWQPSDVPLSGLNAGNHTVDYSNLPNYFRPDPEVVTILPGSTTSVIRAYTDRADLTVIATPESAVSAGAVLWRVDSGIWLATGTPVSLAAGTHTLEFKPTAGWLVPESTTITLPAGATTWVADYHPVHRLRFFLNENLVGSLTPSELQSRLSQYAAHIQTIFHRETVRRFTFDPTNDITICTASPFSNSYTGTMPQTGFEVWAYAQLTDNPAYGTYDGWGSIDQSGAGGANGLKWDTIYDPATLQSDTPQLRQYWTQIDHIVHELEHAFGAGIGEYYSPMLLADPTTVEPILPTTSFVSPDPSDHFWGSRSEYWTDPLTVNIYDHWRAGNPKSLPLLLELTAFAPATSAVIASLHRNSSLATLPDLSVVRVEVIDATTGLLIPNATLRIWNRRNYNSNFEHAVTPSATPGVFSFTWGPYPGISVFGNFDNMKILKAWAPGYTPKAQWEWIYDAQKAKLVDNSDIFKITIVLTPE